MGPPSSFSIGSTHPPIALRPALHPDSRYFARPGGLYRSLVRESASITDVFRKEREKDDFRTCNCSISQEKSDHRGPHNSKKPGSGYRNRRRRSNSSSNSSNNSNSWGAAAVAAGPQQQQRKHSSSRPSAGAAAAAATTAVGAAAAAATGQQQGRHHHSSSSGSYAIPQDLVSSSLGFSPAHLHGFKALETPLPLLPVPTQSG